MLIWVVAVFVSERFVIIVLLASFSLFVCCFALIDGLWLLMFGLLFTVVWF